jgi:hypothetical protein
MPHQSHDAKACASVPAGESTDFDSHGQRRCGRQQVGHGRTASSLFDRASPRGGTACAQLPTTSCMSRSLAYTGSPSASGGMPRRPRVSERLLVCTSSAVSSIPWGHRGHCDRCRSTGSEPSAAEPAGYALVAGAAKFARHVGQVCMPSEWRVTATDRCSRSQADVRCSPCPLRKRAPLAGTTLRSQADVRCSPCPPLRHRVQRPGRSLRVDLAHSARSVE